MDTTQRLQQLRELIKDQKRAAFYEPEKWPDTEGLGILVANWAEWEGKKIVEAFLAALDDANYHLLAEAIEDLWKLDEAEAAEAIETLREFSETERDK